MVLLQLCYGLGRNANADGDVLSALRAIGYVRTGANGELAGDGGVVIDRECHALALC